MDCRFDTLKLLKTWALKRWRLRLLAGFSAAGALSFTVSGNDTYYQSEISPLLEDRCYDCHDYESKKGGFSLDDFLTFSEVSKDKQQWFKVYKNLQAHVMPPPEKTPPSVADRQKILDWIKNDVFAIDPENPDPGRVTLGACPRSTRCPTFVSPTQWRPKRSFFPTPVTRPLWPDLGLCPERPIWRIG